jgi:signal transduction histidine kinase
MALQTHTDPDRAWLAKMTVLYVEDDDDTREALSTFLRRRVGRLFEAPDGIEALVRYRAERPTLVVTDIQMPGMDGLALADELRRIDAGVPIIVTTAFERNEFLERSINAGVDKYVTKPVDLDKLEEILLGCARRLRVEASITDDRQRELEAARAHEREVVGLLAGGMAHDFNNLLQVVLGNVSLAGELAVPASDQHALIEEALAAAHQAKELGRQLISLAERTIARVRRQAVTPTLSAALSVALAGSGTITKLNLPGALPPIWQDAELLGRAFAKLASNAREAMDDGGTLTVEGKARELRAGEVGELSAGHYVELTFRDTGRGIAPDVLARIFDPYFSTKPRGAARGMGLGLSLCRAIVRQHRGAVTAASPPGGGAVFTVLLPTFGPETAAHGEA